MRYSHTPAVDGYQPHRAGEVSIGICRLPEITMYWSSGFFYMPFFRKTMSIKRWKEIFRIFHTHNNLAIPADSTDRLARIQTVMDFFHRRFQTVYTPTCHLSLNEGRMPLRGRLSLEVYEPNKPNKYAVKIYIIAELESGYVVSS